MTRGRPPKRPRNITGLRNQPARSCESHPLNPEYPINRNTDPTGDSNSHEAPTGSPNDQPEQELGLHPDSTRLPINHENTGIELDSSVEELSECAEGDDKGLQKNTPKLAVDRRDDSSDEDWLPSELKKKKQRIGG